MKISRSITLELEDLIKIDNKIKKGEFESVSEFIQQAVKNELKSRDII